MKNWVCLLLGFILATVVATAESSDYQVTAKENGQALVIVTVTGVGLYRLPLQSDVQDIKVKGALYNIENNTALLSIGSTGKAVMLYKTDTLTTKRGDRWTLQLESTLSNSSVTLYLPKTAVIIRTNPQALVEDSDFKKVSWQGNLSVLEVDYRFADQEATSDPSWLYAGAVALGAMSVLAVNLAIKHKKNSGKNKVNLVKTLSENEALVVNILQQNSGQIKRSRLEKLSKIAKSSLASTLKNLERKKIVEVDRTFTTHLVKTTKWFDEL